MARKEWSELAPRSRAQYERTLARAYKQKTFSYARGVPGSVPDVTGWPETTRSILRAALQAFWASRDDATKGLVISSKIKKVRKVETVAQWPTETQADLWLTAAKTTGPRAAFLIAQICFKRGMRSEEVLSTPRANWEGALRWGRLTFIGKGNKERALTVDNITSTIREMLDTPAAQPHQKDRQTSAPSRWRTPGELLAKPGSALGTQQNLFYRYVKKVAEAAGLDPSQWHPHTLRHVFATKYLARGGNERKLQDAMGHATIATISRYTHPTPEDVGKHFEGD